MYYYNPKRAVNEGNEYITASGLLSMVTGLPDAFTKVTFTEDTQEAYDMRFNDRYNMSVRFRTMTREKMERYGKDITFRDNANSCELKKIINGRVTAMVYVIIDPITKEILNFKIISVRKLKEALKNFDYINLPDYLSRVVYSDSESAFFALDTSKLPEVVLVEGDANGYEFKN